MKINKLRIYIFYLITINIETLSGEKIKFAQYFHIIFNKISGFTLLFKLFLSIRKYLYLFFNALLFSFIVLYEAIPLKKLKFFFSIL